MQRRIFILGSSGSGKSTLAKNIAKKYKLPHFDTDDIMWETKYTKKRSHDQRLKLMQEIIAKNMEWVIEGVSIKSIEPALKSATQVVLLDAPTYVRMWRILKRSFKNRAIRNESIKSILELLQFAASYKKAGGYYHLQKQMLAEHNIKYSLITSEKECIKYMDTLK